MKRTTHVSHDESENIVIGLFFKNQMKVLSLFAQYSSEEEKKLAESKLIFCSLFWDKGMPIDELIHSFKREIMPQEKALKKWSEKT